MKVKYKYIIGIDEAGRGPLAGPVAVGAVLFEKGRYEIFKKEIAPPACRQARQGLTSLHFVTRGKTFSRVKDSKQLTEIQREKERVRRQ